MYGLLWNPIRRRKLIPFGSISWGFTCNGITNGFIIQFLKLSRRSEEREILEENLKHLSLVHLNILDNRKT